MSVSETINKLKSSWCCGYIEDVKIDFKELEEIEKQIHKQVCDEIRNLAHNYFELVICDNYGNTIDDDCYISSNDFNEILEKVEKGEK